jgi:hypothetical protein
MQPDSMLIHHKPDVAEAPIHAVIGSSDLCNRDSKYKQNKRILTAL